MLELELDGKRQEREFAKIDDIDEHMYRGRLPRRSTDVMSMDYRYQTTKRAKKNKHPLLFNSAWLQQFILLAGLARYPQSNTVVVA